MVIDRIMPAEFKYYLFQIFGKYPFRRIAPDEPGEYKTRVDQASRSKIIVISSVGTCSPRDLRVSALMICNSQFQRQLRRETELRQIGLVKTALGGAAQRDSLP